MLKSFIATLAALTLLSPGARAASSSRGNPNDAPVDEMDRSELGDLPPQSEAPPAPEPPYPGSEEGQFASDPSMSGKLHDSAPSPSDETWKPANEPPPPRERPIRVNEEGDYIYSTKPTPPKLVGPKAITKPAGVTDSGDFIYDTRGGPAKPVKHPGIESPISVGEDGTYHYELPKSVSKHAMTFRVGILTPPNLRNPNNGLSFADIYGNKPLPVLFGDYEWPIFKTVVGQLSLKVGSGLSLTSAPGHFKDPKRAAEKPEEVFTFLMFPNTVTANYRFRFAERQIFVPFVEGGAGYFTFAEVRDDAKRPKFGASPVAVAAGGINFALDWADPAAVRRLEGDYGINHIWLVLEARGIVGLESTQDFTSTSANLGFLLEF